MQTARSGEGGGGPCRLAALWSERDALFTKRATMPSSERADVDARIAAIGREIAEIVAPQRAAVAGLISSKDG